MSSSKEKLESWKDQDEAPARRPDEHSDPITGAPGAHPIGAGAGAAAGGVVGAVAGAAVAGAAAGAGITGPAAPVGAMVGAVVGAVAGGLAGKGVAEAVHPTSEDAYWREHYKTRPYYEPGRTYDDYRPAYAHGWESRARYPGRSFDEIEQDLRKSWEEAPERSSIGWGRAREAARDAWGHVDADDGTTSRELEVTDAEVESAVGGVVGAGAGAAVGGAIGSAVAPGPGTAVGAAAGGILGATGGAAAGADLADTEEASYWRGAYHIRPYYRSNYSYEEDYLPAYRYGWQSRRRLSTHGWDEVEPHLAGDWEHFKAKSRLTWDQARDAIRDAWDRAGTSSHVTPKAAVAPPPPRPPSGASAQSRGSSKTPVPAWSADTRRTIQNPVEAETSGAPELHGVHASEFDAAYWHRTM